MCIVPSLDLCCPPITILGSACSRIGYKSLSLGSTPTQSKEVPLCVCLVSLEECYQKIELLQCRRQKKNQKEGTGRALQEI